MATIKMRYGIDLGTTNSSICRMENGEPVIRKTDTLKDTLPSCVSFTKKQIIKVGDGAYNDLRSDKSRAMKRWEKSRENVFIEFKRTMGLDTSYFSSNMNRSFSSEELSAEVLKTLKSLISDDAVKAAVITVPAKFKTDQIAATKRAALLAGIEHSELLQEPIAASMAYGLSNQSKEGKWLVFDFGGGTFDAALVKVEDGVMQVMDTEGDNYLGGKNLDYAIVDQIIIPHLTQNYSLDEVLSDDEKKGILREAMKFYAEQAKNQLSFKCKTDITSQLDEFGEDDDGEEIELDMVITQEQLRKVVEPIFQKAIDITKNLLTRNHLSGDDLDTLILVGGPTYSPVLREMLRSQITPNVDTSIDPMTAVAVGATLFASSTDSEVVEEIAQGSIVFDVSYPSNSVENTEFVAIKLLPDECKGTIPTKVFVELTRSDQAWSTGKVEIDRNGDVLECQLLPRRANSFKVCAFDEMGQVLPCFPKEINIMQGFVVGNAVLPYHIGVEVHDDILMKDVFVPLKGLEKNQSLPAVGVKNGLHTPKQLRPGIAEDHLIIPIYQGEHDAEGTSAIYNDHVFDAVITGDDLTTFIPAQSEVDVTIKVDASQMMVLEVNFPALGETISKTVDVQQRSSVSIEEINQRFAQADEKLEQLKENELRENLEVKEAEKLFSELENRYDGELSSQDGRMHLLADLRRVFLLLEKCELNNGWLTLRSQIEKEFERLEKANKELGHKWDSEVSEVKEQVDKVLKNQDVVLGRATLRRIVLTFTDVTLVFQLASCARYYHSTFEQHNWKDPSQARTLVDRALYLINTNGSVRELHLTVIGFLDLLNEPYSEKIKF